MWINSEIIGRGDKDQGLERKQRIMSLFNRHVVIAFGSMAIHSYMLVLVLIRKPGASTRPQRYSTTRLLWAVGTKTFAY